VVEGETGTQEDGVLFPKEVAADGAAKYDWQEEWYPLYLTKEVPDDAALPLTVYDRQLVLYRDADGVLRCHEDRCPHRYIPACPIISLADLKVLDHLL
jgi:phenylpropionate dioxygenase-like ring-hydroxylating dioxygenase large terminal subunit